MVGQRNFCGSPIPLPRTAWGHDRLRPRKGRIEHGLRGCVRERRLKACGYRISQRFTLHDSLFTIHGVGSFTLFRKYNPPSLVPIMNFCCPEL